MELAKMGSPVDLEARGQQAPARENAALELSCAIST